MCKTTVVNKRTSPYDIYIGRGSIWGNPFIIGKDGDREDVVRKFSEYAKYKCQSGEWSRSSLLSLKGKVLGCFCKPLACHGDVLASIVNNLEEDII